MSERHNFFPNAIYPIWFVPDEKPVAGDIFLKFNIQKTDKWTFLMFLAGEHFLENFILKVSQTHFSKDFYPKSGLMPPPPLGCEVPWLNYLVLVTCNWKHQ